MKTYYIQLRLKCKKKTESISIISLQGLCDDIINSAIVKNSTNTTCYKRPYYISEIDFYNLFPSIIFKFDAKTYFEWVPRNYLFFNGWIYCLGINLSKIIDNLYDIFRKDIFII